MTSTPTTIRIIHRRHALVALAGLALVGFTFAAGTVPAQAHGYKLGSIEITHPWSRATPKGAKVAGGYMALANHGAEPDRLVAVETAAAGRVELHEMTMDDGVMKMRPLAQGIALPAGDTVTLAPGGLHVMFLDLKEPFVEGERFAARLVFERAGGIDVEFVVEAVAARGGKGGHHAH